jgi:hypothetical protein
MEEDRVEISTLNENSASSDSESELEPEQQEDAIEVNIDPQQTTSNNSVVPKIPFHQLRIVSRS